MNQYRVLYLKTTWYKKVYTHFKDKVFKLSVYLPVYIEGTLWHTCQPSWDNLANSTTKLCKPSSKTDILGIVPRHF